MKFLRKSALVLLPLTISISHAAPISITEAEINHYLSKNLAKKIALNDRVGIPNLFQLDYKLRDVATKIGQTEEKRVEVMGNVDGLLKLKGKQYDIKLHLNLDTLPYYDAEKGALFLKDIRLIHWTLSPEKYHSEISPFVAPLAQGLASILDSTPVYTLDETKSKEALFKKFGQKITVEKGAIRLETSIF